MRLDTKLADCLKFYVEHVVDMADEPRAILLRLVVEAKDAAPHVKVTEVEGAVAGGDPAYRGRITTQHEDDGVPYRGVTLWDMVPEESRGSLCTDGPRGRWRVTVEFWPQEVMT